MKSNDKLIAIAIGSILVVGAFLVGIIIGLPDSGGSSVRAQESSTPPPKPPPTAEDFDRWEREWAAKNNEGLGTMEIVLEPAFDLVSTTGVSRASGDTAGFIQDPDTGRWVREATFFPSQVGDRVLKFHDGSTKTLPEGVKLVDVVIAVLVECVPGKQCLKAPWYVLEKGESNTLIVNLDGVLSEYSLNNTVTDPSAFSFLTTQD